MPRIACPEPPGPDNHERLRPPRRISRGSPLHGRGPSAPLPPLPSLQPPLDRRPVVPEMRPDHGVTIAEMPPSNRTMLEMEMSPPTEHPAALR